VGIARRKVVSKRGGTELEEGEMKKKKKSLIFLFPSYLRGATDLFIYIISCLL